MFVLFQLFARITKFGWFDVSKDEYIFRNVVTDVGKFIQVFILGPLDIEIANVLIFHRIFVCGIFKVFRHCLFYISDF